MLHWTGISAALCTATIIIHLESSLAWVASNCILRSHAGGGVKWGVMYLYAPFVASCNVWSLSIEAATVPLIRPG